jgi:hypothetical protein
MGEWCSIRYIPDSFGLGPVADVAVCKWPQEDDILAGSEGLVKLGADEIRVDCVC